MTIEIALYQPDMPQNVGSILRTSVAFDYKVHIIMPTGFVFNEQKMRRAGMDYLDRANFEKHSSFDEFKKAMEGKRIVLMTTKGAEPLQDFTFKNGDVLLFGRESAGVPDDVHAWSDERVFIPMKKGERSINLAQSVAISAFRALSDLNIRVDL